MINNETLVIKERIEPGAHLSIGQVREYFFIRIFNNHEEKVFSTQIFKNRCELVITINSLIEKKITQYLT